MENNSAPIFFAGRKALLATRHGKELVIAPALKEHTGLLVEVTHRVDTDLLGTFCGSTPRPGDQLSTLRRKVAACFEAHPECPIALGSEGAFGSHPASPFLPFNCEMVMLRDRERDIEITGIYGTTAVFSLQRDLTAAEDIAGFLRENKFPEYGFLLRQGDQIYKDFASEQEARLLLDELLRRGIPVTAETDMRAHKNPTRMQQIRQAALDLAARMNSLCSKCASPGFWIKEAVSGLPCDWCGRPTKLLLKEVHRCDSCGYEEGKLFPRGNETADPGSCDYCNP